MDFGLLIIGDEILHGTRVDAHFSAVKTLLAERGLRLKWVTYLADEPEQIAASLQRSFAAGEVVFVTGGIGGTPDDHTRQAAAAALGLPLVEHPEAAKLINQIGLERGDDLDSPLQKQRLQMANFPEGADIIPNPFNRIAGFSIRAHYFVPGFPVMAHPMLAWVLDTYYAEQSLRARHEHISAQVFGLQESQISPLMVMIEQRFAGVKTYSLPTVGAQLKNGVSVKVYQIELGVKASGVACDDLSPAWQTLVQAVRDIGGEIEL
jgi:molybdopterin-biosynthesis enzyme MoeA-like protein